MIGDPREAHRGLRHRQHALLQRRHRHAGERVRVDHAMNVGLRRVNRAVDDEAGEVEGVVEPLRPIGLPQHLAFEVHLDQRRSAHLLVQQSEGIEQELFGPGDAGGDVVVDQVVHVVVAHQAVRAGAIDARLPLGRAHPAFQRLELERRIVLVRREVGIVLLEIGDLGFAHAVNVPFHPVRRKRSPCMLKRILPLLCMGSFWIAGLAQDFPTRPVRIVVPWPPSGNVDITARTLAPAFSEALGQQVIVENRAGAGGTIGTAAVVRSPAAGYTLLLGSSGTVTSGPAVFRNLSYDPLRDLVAVGPIQSVPIVLTVAPKTPVSSFQEYFSLAQSRPGRVSIASAGDGSSNHLAIELLMRQANLKLLHVPYKGSGPALTDLIGSQVESMMDQLTASIGHIREGRIRALAISSAKRSPLLPEVPTLDELGVKGYEAATFTGIFAPAGISPQITEKLSTALRKAMANETVRERYRAMGVEVMDMAQVQFVAYVRADYEKWQRVAREGNIVVE